MIIGVISDTHSHKPPKQLMDFLKKVDLIIHVGDFCTEEDMKVFSSIKKIKAVCGNMDESALRNKLPVKDIFEVEGVKIGIFHGRGMPKHILEDVVDEFKSDGCDAVVFGHSHEPFNKVIKGVLYFNPGTPMAVYSASGCTYGIIKVNEGKISGEIIEVKE
ncbi:MAG: metallophosphoesterase family protein [Candidatus Omnitrophica bacterium]|nr:metallophosphoesterase family protein [Candidatus Omnitrophota bacterium]